MILSLDAIDVNIHSVPILRRLSLEVAQIDPRGRLRWRRQTERVSPPSTRRFWPVM